MDTISGRRIAGFIGLVVAIVVVVLGIGSMLSGGTPAPTAAPASPAGSAPASTFAPFGSPPLTPRPEASAPRASSGDGPKASIEIPPPID